MKKLKSSDSIESELPAAACVGRKRDPSLDATILESTIDVLADLGFDGMTMDIVAARAKAGKAALYRRWPSKTELVREALSWMTRNHLELETLPDTGSLRGDLLALLKPHSIAEAQRKFQVLAGLGTFWCQQPSSRSETSEIFGPWTEANRTLMQRAVDRGEIPPGAEIELACKIMNAMASYRGLIERQSFDRSAFTRLIDGILLPALKNPPKETKTRRL